MKYPKIDHLILFGGSRLLAEFALYLNKQMKYSMHIYSCERQLKEQIFPDGRTLGSVLKTNKIEFRSVEDINSDAHVNEFVTTGTLGIGMGEAWQFSKELIKKFDGRLVDFMGIRLPQYRGGAHYSWQILRKTRLGCANLQVVN